VFALNPSFPYNGYSPFPRIIEFIPVERMPIFIDKNKPFHPGVHFFQRALKHSCCYQLHLRKGSKDHAGQ
jgi:hypothetical protein